MFYDKVIAAIRTGAAALGAYLVTVLVTWLTDQGFEIEIDPTTSTVLAGVLFALFVGLYNLVVNLLTEHVWDGFGWLLGVNKPPVYLEGGQAVVPEE